ncbi:hypothetical protein BABINDRAFT_158918 [Babjeviella inositovora NRRL Y-12698]|uniref:DUF2470 domain-containing protein n=1 Tax=Babjeviella inositovora NRRL Y-12698 TaxID=984486 RepID=A0A1E3QX84_9ASCO|nr:uncharacterized protein BABINDRAFT_158918 [Babjeviella inositovora NRRL Y-12698]ODQ82293.1 hypothetical protein BABINDRAFT_158918 [Babjeviella inositovora NRRL Y-12698]
MNKDHKLAIEDLLVHYAGIPITEEVSQIKLKEISTISMTISFHHEGLDTEVLKPIPFEPPMTSLDGEARTRLVELAKTAATARGFSHIQINQYVYPNSLLEYFLLLVLLYMGSVYYRWDASKDIPVWFPLFSNYGKIIIGVLAVIHVVEIRFVLLPLLRKYRVPTDYKLEWIIATLLEGMFSIQRLQKLIWQAENHGRNTKQ